MKGFRKCFILDIREGFEYASEQLSRKKPLCLTNLKKSKDFVQRLQRIKKEQRFCSSDTKMVAVKWEKFIRNKNRLLPSGKNQWECSISDSKIIDIFPVCAIETLWQKNIKFNAKNQPVRDRRQILLLILTEIK